MSRTLKWVEVVNIFFDVGFHGNRVEQTIKMADKKLAKKLAKMSEEDRAAFLENKRLQDEEVKKKKEEQLYRFLKNKLLKEEETSKVNMLKVQKQWRDIMRRGRIWLHLDILFSF